MYDSSADAVHLIFTAEPIPGPQVGGLLKEICPVPKPSGSAVRTIVPSFNPAPFTVRESNIHGTNIDIKTLVDAARMGLSLDDPGEFKGSAEFAPQTVLYTAMKFAQGNIAPNVAQSFVFEKVS